MQPMNDSSEALQLGLGQLLQGTRPTTSLQAIITSVLERIHAEFGILLNTAAACNDDERKRLALSYLHSCRQQLLRLVALMQWHPKYKAQLQCLEPGQVLDTARKHAQMLEAAAVELYEAHMRAQPDFSPMFDVQTALDVLSTGAYTDLPSSIEKLGSAAKPSPEQQARKLRHITHLLHSHLLKTHLPEGVTVKEVGKGYVILTALDLYEVKLTLVPAMQLPAEEPTKQEPGSGGTATGNMDVHAPGAGAAAGTSKGVSMEVDDDEVTSGKPATRWRWYLLDFSILAKAVQGPALKDQQSRSLLQDLNNRMHVAADAAVYEHRRRLAGGGSAGGGGAAGVGPTQITGSQLMSGGGPQHTPALSKQPGVSGLSGQGATPPGARPYLTHNLALLSQYAADEASAPIMILHSVLSDVSGRLLVDASRTVSQQLTGPGGCWHGHTTLQPGTSPALELGFTITFWTKAAPLLPLTPPQGSTAGLARGVKQETGVNQINHHAKPYIELGIAPDGHVQVLSNVSSVAAPPVQQTDGSLAPPPPPAAATGSGAVSESGGARVLSAEESALCEWGGFSSPLVLNAVMVNVDELLLKAAGQLVWREMLALKDQLARDMQHVAVPGTSWQLKLAGCSTHVLPVTAQHLVQTLTVQQAISSTGAAAGRAARQARATLEVSCTSSTAGDGGGAAQADGQQGGGVSDPGAGLQVEVRFPVLEFWSCGELLVKLSRSLFTGRLLVQPGPGLAGDANLQSLANWSQREEDVNSLLMRVYLQPVSQTAAAGGPGKDTPSARMLPELSLKLSNLLKEQQRALAISSCMSAARQLHLHLGGPSSKLINAFHSEHPWVDIKRFYTLWSLPPTAFPPNFPPLYTSPPGSPPAFTPHCLSAVLGADHPSNPRATYSLFVVACSSQMLPLKVLKVVPVPQQVYSFTGQVVEAQDQPQAPHSTLQARPLSSDMQGARSMEADGFCVDSPPGGRQPPPSSSSTGHTARAGGRPQAHSPQLRPGAVGGLSTGGSGLGPSALPVRDLHRELGAVVGWCQRRFSWEKLVVQLKALSVGFVEANLSDPHHPGTCIQIHSLAGISLPCRIARRKGLHPARVGLRRITLSTSCGGDQEQVQVVVHGSWFSSSTHQQQRAPHVGTQPRGGHSTAGLRAQSITQPGPGQVCLTYSFAHGQSALDVLLDLVCIIRMQTFLARLECTAVGNKQLCVHARAAKQGQDGAQAAGAGGIELGKRNLMDWEGSEQVYPSKAQRVQNTAPGAAGLPSANGNHGLLQSESSLNHGMHAQLDNGVDSQLSAGDSNVEWSWAPNGCVRLVHYDLTSAVLEWRPSNDEHSTGGSGLAGGQQGGPAQNGAAAAPYPGTVVKLEGGGVQGPGHEARPPAGPQRLQFKFRWVPGSLPPNSAQHAHQHLSGASPSASSLNRATPTGTGTPHTASLSASPLPPGIVRQPSVELTAVGGAQARDTHELVQCEVTWMQAGGAAGGSAGEAWQRSSSSSLSVGVQTGPLDALLQSLGEMAAVGEEGLLLDTLFLAAQPMHALQVSFDMHCPQPGRAQLAGGADGLGGRLLHAAHVSEHAPLQHEVVISLPVRAGAKAEGAGGGAGAEAAVAKASAAGGCVVLRFVCMAVGRVWLCVSVPEQLGGKRTAGELLAVLLHQLQEHLGKQAVFVATAWSQLVSGAASTPRQSGTAWVWSSLGQARKQMWLLIKNNQLEQAMHVLLHACERVLND